MVPKITTGGGLRGALEYDQSQKNGHEKRHEFVCGTLLGTPRQAAHQAGILRKMRPDCRKPVWRCSLSLPPADGPKSVLWWEKVVQDFMKEMGIPHDAPHRAVRHIDKDHDHIHFTLLRILPDGSLWNQEHSAKRAISACARLEEKHGLKSHDRTPSKRRRPARSEIEISRKKGKEMSREHIQKSIDQIFTNHPQGLDFEAFKSALNAAGVDVFETKSKEGKLLGYSYSGQDQIKWTGSKLGGDYTLKSVQSRGLQLGEQDHPSQPQTAPQPTPARADFVSALQTQNHDKNRHQKLQKSLTDLRSVMVNLPLSLINSIWRFVSKVLSKLGFKLSEKDLIPLRGGAPQSAPEISHQPELLVPQADQVHVPVSEIQHEKNAIDLVASVADALIEKDVELLPQGEGREVLQAELNGAFEAGGGFEIGDAEGMVSVVHKQLKPTAQRVLDTINLPPDSPERIGANSEFLEVWNQYVSAIKTYAKTANVGAVDGELKWQIEGVLVQLDEFSDLATFDEFLASGDESALKKVHEIRLETERLAAQLQDQDEEIENVDAPRG